MPRELRIDYGGRCYRWFDVDEMMKVHGPGLTDTLMEEIKQNFNVPLNCQVLCDAEGPLTSPADLRRLLMGVAPRLYLFDSRQMGEAAHAGACGDSSAIKTRPADPVPSPVESGQQNPVAVRVTPVSPAPPQSPLQNLAPAPGTPLGSTPTPSLAPTPGGGVSPRASAASLTSSPSVPPSVSWAQAAPARATPLGTPPLDARSTPRPSTRATMCVPAHASAPAAPLQVVRQHLSSSSRSSACRGLEDHCTSVVSQTAAPPLPPPAQRPRQPELQRAVPPSAGAAADLLAPPPGDTHSEELPTNSASSATATAATGPFAGAPLQRSSPTSIPRRQTAPLWLPQHGATGTSNLVQVVLAKSEQGTQVFGFTNVPEVTPDGRECLRISKVDPDGLLADWNERFPQQSLAVGDRVLSVNGVQGDILQMRALLCGASVRITAERCCPGPLSPGRGETPASSSRSRPDEQREEGLRRRVRQAQERLGSAGGTPRGSFSARAGRSHREASRLRFQMIREELQGKDMRIQELEQQLSSWQRLAEPLGGACGSPLLTPRSTGTPLQTVPGASDFGGLAGKLGLLGTPAPSSGWHTPRPGGDADEELRALHQGMWQMAALVAEKESEIEELQLRVANTRQRSEASAQAAQDRASQQRIDALESQLQLLSEQLRARPVEESRAHRPAAEEPHPQPQWPQGLGLPSPGPSSGERLVEERLLQRVTDQAEEMAVWGQRMRVMESRMQLLSEESQQDHAPPSQPTVLNKRTSEAQPVPAPVPALQLQAGPIKRTSGAWKVEQGDTDGDAATIRMSDCWRSSAAAVPVSGSLQGLRPRDVTMLAAGAAGNQMLFDHKQCSKVPKPPSEEDLHSTASPRSDISLPSSRRRASPRRTSPRLREPSPSPSLAAPSWGGAEELSELRELQRALAAAAGLRGEEEEAQRRRDASLARQLASQEQEIQQLQTHREHAELAAAQAREREQAARAAEAGRRCEVLEQQVPAEMRMLEEMRQYQLQVAQAEATQQCEMQELRRQERAARDLEQQQQVDLAVELLEQDRKRQADLRSKRDQAHLARLVQDAEALSEQEFEVQELLFASALQKQRPSQPQAWQRKEQDMEAKVEQHKRQRQEMALRVEAQEREQWVLAFRMEEQEQQRREMAASVKQQEQWRKEMAVVIQRQEQQIQELTASRKGEERTAAALKEKALEIEELQQRLRGASRNPDTKELEAWELREHKAASVAAEMQQEIQQLRSCHEGEQEMAALVAQKTAELQELQRFAHVAPRPSLVQRSERKAAHEASEAEAWKESEMRASSEVQVKDIEVERLRQQDKERQERMASLESQLEELASRPAVPPEPEPRSPPPEPQEELAPVKRWYIATGEDELDRQLEAQLSELGTDPLKGNNLVRTGPSKYKLGEQRVFMKLNEGNVTVRDSGKFISLAQWTKDVEPATSDPRGTLVDDDLFGAMDAASPYAQHG